VLSVRASSQLPQRLFDNELERNKAKFERRISEAEGALANAHRDKIHVTMSNTKVKQYRTVLRADLADDVHIVSVSGLGGRGKSSLLQDYLSSTYNNQGQCVTPKQSHKCIQILEVLVLS
jgi:predicted ribonuclease YlaK